MAGESFEVMFDWRDYQATRNINEISNEINIVPPHTQNSGTRLIISDLKDRWSEAAIKRVYHYLEDVLQPVSEFNENEGGRDALLDLFKDYDKTIEERKKRKKAKLTWSDRRMRLQLC